MTKTEELLKLAEAATPGPWWREDEEDSSYLMVEAKGQTVVKLHSEGDCEFIAAANPATIKQLVELVRLQHEYVKLMKEYGPSVGFGDTTIDEAIVAYERFEKGGE